MTVVLDYLFGKQAPASAPAPAPTPVTFEQPADRVGLLVTEELDKALEETKATVTRIAKECRRKNRKFRDIEFDIENDRDRCLHGLDTSRPFNPSDVARVTDIFEQPQFFVDGASSADLIQGALGDCWFVSALATISTCPGLLEKSCVARDEQVGVYGFIFFRDMRWVSVVIDDLLCTKMPRFEELAQAERVIFQDNKDLYNASARKGTKSLYFARSATENETWVPLIEKAYAKLHGSYAALQGGDAAEAIEDLTGAVSTAVFCKDILDPDAFWTKELLKANSDRLFGCGYNTLDSSRNSEFGARISGLVGGHAYSVLRAKEVNGKRFLVVRNPWGESEWTGAWADGSKQWTREWLGILEELEHEFGDDGQFVMEYKDFLAVWSDMSRTLLFDSSWVMSTQWLEVPSRPALSAWSFGEVSFTISLPAASPAILVLSKLDTRYFRELVGSVDFYLDFLVYKAGESEPMAESDHVWMASRSVTLEVDLEAGEYVVHIRIDRQESKPEPELLDALPRPTWDARAHARALTERAISRSIASNFNPASEPANLPLDMSALSGQTLAQVESKVAEMRRKEKEKVEAEAKAKQKAAEEEEAKQKAAAAVVVVAASSETTTTTMTSTTVVVAAGTAEADKANINSASVAVVPAETGAGAGAAPVVAASLTAPITAAAVPAGDSKFAVPTPIPTPDAPGPIITIAPTNPDASAPVMAAIDENALVLGLRVYTKKDAPAKIAGQLRGDIGTRAELAKLKVAASTATVGAV
ncbi:Calpain catalytic domain-containing protein [Mycena kentingensis (nom. inval.)]|nr:Calpain catalytic domain-containing protein [Mycena kentingensis (nom. inval.)]